MSRPIVVLFPLMSFDGATVDRAYRNGAALYRVGEVHEPAEHWCSVPEVGATDTYAGFNWNFGGCELQIDWNSKILIF